MIKVECVLLIVFLFYVSSSVKHDLGSLVHEWVTLDYDWISEEQKEQYVIQNKYIPSNNCMAGIKVWKNEIYVTVPRWRDGVPSTLNKVVAKNGDYVLQPYPSWEMQEIGDLTKLQYVQSMEIDSRGWMWIIDVARINLMGNGQPVLLIWDMEKNCSIRRYPFPESTFPYSGSFANDIVVDETTNFAYISDTWANGGIVVYDFNNNLSRRFDHPTLMGNASNYMPINGELYHVVNPSDGIALSHDGETVYYSSLSRTELYSVPTSALKDFSMTNEQIGQHVQHLGVKGYSDGLTFSDAGILFYGSLATSSVDWWHTKYPLSTAQVLVGDADSMQWPDTFAWDNDGYIYFVSNKLQKFFFGEMKFDGSDGYNFRIWMVNVGMKSYLSQNPIPRELPCVPF